MKNEFFVNTDDLAVVQTVPEDATGNFAVVSSVETLMEQFDKPKLKLIIAGVRGKALNGDENKSQKKLAFEVYKMVTEPKAEKVAAEKKPAKITKVSIARDILEKKVTISKKDLAEAVGHDLPNCHTMISILKNPARTKSPLFVAYNKATAEYTLCANLEAMTAKEKEFTDAAVKTAEDAEAVKVKEKTDKAAKTAADKAAKTAADKAAKVAEKTPAKEETAK